MKLITVVLTTLLLSGCLWQTTDLFDIKAAEQICKDNNSKVNKIFSHFDNEIEVMCTNQKTYNIKELSYKLYLLNLEKN